MSETPCIIADGSTYRGGYKQIYREGRQVQAHRWAWEQAFGPIPDGLHVLHHCDNPPCWNVDHLFLGTQADNNRDRSKKGRTRNQHQDKTHCPEGHPYDEANTYSPPSGGERQCRECKRNNGRVSARRRRAERRAAA